MKLEKIDQARYAVAAAFLLGGISVGLWFVHIPIVSQRLDLTTSMLGFVFFTIAIGAVIAQLSTGFIISNIGKRLATSISLPILLTCSILPIAAHNLIFLFIAAFIFGLSAGFYNITINMQASQIQAERELPTMSFFHGFFSLGGLIAAILGSFIISNGWADGTGAGTLAIVMLIATTYFVKYYLVPSTHGVKKASKTNFKWPNKAILALAAMSFACQMVEGAIGDWSALFLITIKNSSPADATIGYAALSIAMASIRFAGAAIINKTSEVFVLAGGGVFIILGVIITVASPWAVLSAVGFFVIGVGTANAFPVLLGMAGRSSDFGLTVTATIGQMGLIIGPTIIGFIADAYNLSYGIGFLAVMAVVIITLSVSYKR